jgi:hypothetical protein
MKSLTASLLILVASSLVLLDAFWFHPRAASAQGTMKVYVQSVKNKNWTDIQGTQIVGFACGPIARGNDTECFVASR